MRSVFASSIALLALVTPLASADEANAFFIDTEVRDIFITFDNPNWYDELFASHQNDPDDPYFPARFEYADIGLDPVGVRFKGNSSFGIPGMKKSFKIDFNEYQEGTDNVDETTFFGLKKLNLNNSFKDPTMLREKLFLDFIGAYGPAIRATHIRVHVNGEYWGLYTAVEQIDKTFITSRFGDNADGNLFEGEASGETPQSSFGSDLTYLGSNPESYYGKYELKTNETENDWSAFVNFVDVLNNTPDGQLEEALDEVLDVDGWLMSLAQDILFANLDSYLGSAHNFFLYQNDDDDRFTYLHWDTNETFGTFRWGMAPGEDLLSLDPFWLPQGHPSQDSLSRPLMEQVWAVPTYRRAYLRSLARMLREGFDPDSFGSRITELADLIRADVYADPNKPYSNNQFETALTNDLASGQTQVYGLLRFVQVRSTYLELALDAEAEATDIRLNELLTVNLASIADEHGDHDPWLEIHNLGPGRVNVGNFALSTDDGTQRWSLPAGDLDDGQFLVLWLDGEADQGDSHADFSLDPNGGELHLWSGDTVIDSVTYPALGGDEAYTRLPDGEGGWTSSDTPTPGAANLGSTTPPPIFVNELLAENDETLADLAANGGYADWFELYNAGQEDADLGGMYLTDDLEDPTKWQIPSGVTIEARGHLLIWADNDPEQGPDHATFKLDAEGEALGLFASDGTTLIDGVVFPAQSPDISYGRVADGAADFTFFNRPTPGGPNAVGPRSPGGRFRP